MHHEFPRQCAPAPKHTRERSSGALARRPPARGEQCAQQTGSSSTCTVPMRARVALSWPLRFSSSSASHSSTHDCQFPPPPHRMPCSCTKGPRTFTKMLSCPRAHVQVTLTSARPLVPECYVDPKLNKEGTCPPANNPRLQCAPGLSTRTVRTTAP